MARKKKLTIHEDGVLPLITSGITVKYSESEINTNWLLNKILGTKGLQITKVSDDEVLKFIAILDASKLKMHDGTDSLQWLSQRMEKRYNESLAKRGMTWEKISRRFQYIKQQIDLILATRLTSSY